MPQSRLLTSKLIQGESNLRSAIVSIMVEAVRRASRGLSRDFGEISGLQSSTKGIHKFVEFSWRRTEKTLANCLCKSRPGYSFQAFPYQGSALAPQSLVQSNDYAEDDQGPPADTSYHWVVYPISGLSNFSRAIPCFAISVALVRSKTALPHGSSLAKHLDPLEDQGNIVAGVIYNPLTNELFAAEKGCGAYLNDSRLRVSLRKDIAGSFIGATANHNCRDTVLQIMNKLLQSKASMRLWGCRSLSLAYVSGGSVDSHLDERLCLYEDSAAILMAREAGGMVSSLDVSGDAFFIVSNGKINENLRKIIN